MKDALDYYRVYRNAGNPWLLCVRMALKRITRKLK